MTPAPARLVAAVAFLAAALAGCAAAGGGGSAGTTTADARAQATPVWREAARCIRDHGYPDFPDPMVKEDGTVELPESVGRKLDREHQDAVRACEPILTRLPVAVLERLGQADQEGGPPPEVLAERKAFARCMRAHGEPDWPDPGPDGKFTLPTTPGFGKGPGSAEALETCRKTLGNPQGDLGVR